MSLASTERAHNTHMGNTDLDTGNQNQAGERLGEPQLATRYVFQTCLSTASKNPLRKPSHGKRYEAEGAFHDMLQNQCHQQRHIQVRHFNIKQGVQYDLDKACPSVIKQLCPRSITHAAIIAHTRIMQVRQSRIRGNVPRHNLQP